jgi:chromosome segregation ATPase
VACGIEVKKGEGYYHAASFRGPKIVRHHRCGAFRQSQLTGNDKLSTLYSSFEDVQDWIAACNEFDIDGAKEAMEACASEIENVAEMYRESQSNMEDGFQHATSQSDELGDNADQLEDFAGDVRSAGEDLEEFDEDAANDEFLASIEDDDEFALSEFDNIEAQAAAINTAREVFVSEKRDEWATECMDAMEEVLGNSPF